MEEVSPLSRILLTLAIHGRNGLTVFMWRGHANDADEPTLMHVHLESTSRIVLTQRRQRDDLLGSLIHVTSIVASNLKRTTGDGVRFRTAIMAFRSFPYRIVVGIAKGKR